MKALDRWLGIALTGALLVNVAVELSRPKDAAADSFAQMKWDIQSLVVQTVQRCTVTGSVHISSAQSGQLTGGSITC